MQICAMYQQLNTTLRIKEGSVIVPSLLLSCGVKPSFFLQNGSMASGGCSIRRGSHCILSSMKAAEQLLHTASKKRT